MDLNSSLLNFPNWETNRNHKGHSYLINHRIRKAKLDNLIVKHFLHLLRQTLEIKDVFILTTMFKLLPLIDTLKKCNSHLTWRSYKITSFKS